MIIPKNILIIFISLFAMSGLLHAQEVSVSATSAARTKKVHKKFDEQPPKKGFHWSVEWAGEYGGTRNYVDHQHFGITFKGNLLNRNSVHFNAGYLFNPYLYVGAGTGVEYQDRGFADINSGPGYYYNVGALWVVPVYGEIRGYLWNKPTTPFLQLRVGYAPSIYVAEKMHTTENSSYNNLSLGIRIYNHVSVTLGYLFMYQKAYLTGYDRFGPVAPLIETSHPYQHYCTVGSTINF